MTGPDVSGAIERALGQLKIRLNISQPYCSSRTVTVELWYGDTLLTEASDTIPDNRDDSDY